jgi:hypothetical protein
MQPQLLHLACCSSAKKDLNFFATRGAFRGDDDGPAECRKA